MSQYGQIPAYDDGIQLVQFLPTLALNAAEELEENTDAPWPLIVSCLLGAMSLAVQPLYDVCFKKGRSAVPCSLYLVVLAESGAGKTSVSDPVMDAFRRHDTAADERYAVEMEQFRVDNLKWDTINKAYLRRLAKEAEKGLPTDEVERLLKKHSEAKPPEPRNSRILFNDVTPEKLLYELRGERRSAALWADEGGVIFQGRVLNDLASINKLWDNDANLSIERKASESFRVDDPRVTMAVFVQPKVFENYLERCTQNQSAPMESGFLPRCLVTDTISRQGMKPEKNHELVWNHQDRFTARVEALLAQYTAQPGCQRQTLTLSSGAEDILAEYERFIECEKGEGGRYWSVNASASRATNNAARLAAIFHVFDGSEGTVIGEEHMSKATDLIDWYMERCRDLFSVEARIREDAEYLDQWLQARLDRFPYEWTLLRRNGPSRLKNKKGAKEDRLWQAMEFLLAEGKYRSYTVNFRKLIIDLPGYIPRPIFV